MLGLDYSSGRPRASEIARLGYKFVIRYCVPGRAKSTDAAEIADMLAHNIAVLLVWETTAARAAAGFVAGVADAKAATAFQAQVGIPSSRPIYYAVDYDANPPDVEAYFKGVLSVPGVDGDYGSFRVIQFLRTHDGVPFAWQTVAWSHGQVDAGKNIFQRLQQVTIDGVQCDVNESFTADFGQYPVEGEMQLSDRVRIILLNKDTGKEEVFNDTSLENLLAAIYFTLFGSAPANYEVSASAITTILSQVNDMQVRLEQLDDMHAKITQIWQHLGLGGL